MGKLQRRFSLAPAIRLDGAEAEGKKLIGRAIVWNSLSRDLGGFVERFQPGSVTESVRGGIVCALLNHDTSKPLGNQQNGTLRLVEDSQGLNYEIDLPDTSYARDAASMIARGDGTGTSFAFNPTETLWSVENGQVVADVVRADLGEISPLVGVPPAYPASSLAMRSGIDGEQIDYADRYGIDIDKLAAVFIRIKRGFALTPSEEQTMHEARRLFAAVKRPLLEQAENRASQLLM